MEWPYASHAARPAAARRARRSPSPSTASSTARTAPIPRSRSTRRSTSYAGNTVHPQLGGRREGSTRPPGTPYSWVRARVLGGKTNFWGRGALRYGPLQFNAASRDGFDVDWPIRYDGRDALLRQGRRAARLLGYQRRADAGAGRRLPAPDRSSIASRCRSSARSRRWAATTFPAAPASPPTASSTTSTGRAAWAAAAAAAAATSARRSIRRRRSSIRRATAATSPSGRTRWCPKCSSTRPSNRATGVRVIDANTREVMDFKAPVVVLGAGALDTHAHPAQLEVARASATGSGIRRACSAAT